MEATELITALGSALGIELKLDAEGTCAFSADETTITINHLGQFDVLVLSGDLGEPPPERLEALYEAMLEANHLFAGTGGATLSRDSETGHFAICRALPCRALDADSFYAQVEQFVSTVEAWTKLVANFRAVPAVATRAHLPAAPEAPSGEAMGLDDILGLRV